MLMFMLFIIIIIIVLCAHAFALAPRAALLPRTRGLGPYALCCP